MRGMFDLMNICGEVVIGEGLKDEAPGIFKGEQLGTWVPGSPQFDIAVDPIDGTTNISKGAPNSISCIAAASPEEGVKVALRDVPSFYMMKLSYGPRVIHYMQKRGDTLNIDSPIPETLAIVARAGKTSAGCRRHDAGPAAPQGNCRGDSQCGRVAAHDRRWRYCCRHGAIVAGERYRSLHGHGRITGSRPRRGRNQMPGRRDAMQDVAARRKGTQTTHRRRL